jgi:glycerol-3-phosphate dehydrogenase
VLVIEFYFVAMPSLSTHDRQRLHIELQQKEFDLLVVGGGATGAGIALDATSRGLSVALIEHGDFASGTSSRSTKLIHGGVRYLEKAVKEFDAGQYALVREALHERRTLLRIAPHLTRALGLLTPLYHRWEIPYYVAGLKMYEWLAQDRTLQASRYVSRDAALRMCPMLKKEKLRGGVLYYDGQFDDARMNVALITKAVQMGAVAANYVSASKPVLKDGKLVGFEVIDSIDEKTLNIRAKVTINATGPFCDELRAKTDPQASKILETSSGAHIILPRTFSARESGLLIPKTDDGRVLFLLPWLGHTLVGTTDTPCSLSYTPRATADDVAYILEQLSKYFAVKVTHANILSCWAGIRPLVSPSSDASTAQISREHYLEKLPSGLITITGGKWTTYRVMAEETVDMALGDRAKDRPSKTFNIPLTGAENFAPDTESRLQKEFKWDPLLAKYLTRAYGSNAFEISALADKSQRRQLVEGHPHLEAEVDYAVEHELACTSADIICRRLRLGFLDSQAAEKALPKVNAQLAKKADWNSQRQERDKAESLAYLKTLGRMAK